MRKDKRHINKKADKRAGKRDSIRDIETGKRSGKLLKEIQPQGGISTKDEKIIKTGGGYETCVKVIDYPTRVNEHWLAYLTNIEDTVATLDISTLDLSEVKKNLNKSMQEQSYRADSATKYGELYEAKRRIEEMQLLYDDIQSMGEAVKTLTARIFVADRTTQGVEKKTAEIISALESDGYRGAVFLNEQKEEFLSAFRSYTAQQKGLWPVPGQPMPSMILAGGNPFHFSALLDPHGDFLGTTPCGGNVLFDEFIKTKQRLHYNSLVVGVMGTGKSTILKKRFLARAIRGDFIRTFDMSGEFAPLTKELGGRIIRLDGSQGILNPLEILRSGETEGQSYMRHISKVSAIYRFFVSGDATQEEMGHFETLLRQLYEERDLAGRGGRQVTGRKPSEYPTFSDLLTFIDGKIEEIEKGKYNKMEEEVKKKQLLYYDRIRGVVRNICINYGDIFDGVTTIEAIQDQQIVTFDVSQIKEYKAEIFDAAIFSMISFCWDNCVTNGKIMKDKYDHGEIADEDIIRSLIIIDEAHNWINTEKPYALDQILTYLREARKFFGGLMLASQSIRDFVPEGAGGDGFNKIKTIFELTQYKFIFRQDEGVMDLINKVFSGVLTASQQERIPRLQVGETMLSIASAENLEFKVELSEEEAMLFAGGA